VDESQNIMLSDSQKKKSGDMAQIIEYLPSKYKALNSNPSTAKKKKEATLWCLILFCWLPVGGCGSWLEKITRKLGVC
jgi:hypothetical protein